MEYVGNISVHLYLQELMSSCNEEGFKYSALCVVCRGRKRYVSEGDGGAIKAPED